MSCPANGKRLKLDEVKGGLSAVLCEKVEIEGSNGKEVESETISMDRKGGENSELESAGVESIGELFSKEEKFVKQLSSAISSKDSTTQELIEGEDRAVFKFLMNGGVGGISTIDQPHPTEESVEPLEWEELCSNCKDKSLLYYQNLRYVETNSQDTEGEEEEEDEVNNIEDELLTLQDTTSPVLLQEIREANKKRPFEHLTPGMFLLFRGSEEFRREKKAALAADALSPQV